MSKQFDNIQLYGRDDTEGIVGLQVLDDNPKTQEAWMRLYFRDGETVTYKDDKLYPFFYVNDMTLLPAVPVIQVYGVSTIPFLSESGDVWLSQ